jgi:hypothetical protein
VRFFWVQILLAVFAIPSVHADARSMCFVSEGSESVTRLKFVFPDSETELGEVRYEKGHGAIKIKRVKEVELARHGDRSSEVQTNFVELLKQGEGGSYEVVTQGAVVLSLKFVPRTKAKALSFRHETDAEGEDGCGWQSRR